MKIMLEVTYFVAAPDQFSFVKTKGRAQVECMLYLISVCGSSNKLVQHSAVTEGM